MKPKANFTGLLHGERSSEAMQNNTLSGNVIAMFEQSDSMDSLLQNECELSSERADFIHNSSNGCAAFPVLLCTQPKNCTDTHNTLSEFVRPAVAAFVEYERGGKEILAAASATPGQDFA